MSKPVFWGVLAALVVILVLLVAEGRG